MLDQTPAKHSKIPDQFRITFREQAQTLGTRARLNRLPNHQLAEHLVCLTDDDVMQSGKLLASSLERNALPKVY